MRYILLIYDDEKGWANLSEAERQHSMGEFEKLRQEIAGRYVAGSQLHPTSATTSVRTRNGKRMVIDGPFAETREQIGGFWLIDVKDLDAAIACSRANSIRTHEVPSKSGLWWKLLPRQRSNAAAGEGNGR